MGGEPNCLDVQECAVENGGCGDPLYWVCEEVVGGAPGCQSTGVVDLLVSNPYGCVHDE